MALKDILGHSKQINLLRQAIQHGRVPHAYMFSGVSGSGKRLVAENLAKVLNCQNPVDPENSLAACDGCSACNKIAHRSHPDIYFVEADGKFIKTEQLRDILKSVSFKPYEGRWKIFIINDAEKLHGNAANVLLKTLEEPTERTLFILVTAFPQQILKTVISRCQQIKFGGIPFDKLVNAIRRRSELSETESQFYAKMGEGSLGNALSLIDGEIRTIANEHLSPLTEFLAEVDLNESRWVEKLFELGAELAKEKDELPLIVDLLRSWYRDLILWQSTGDDSLLIHQNEKERIAEHAQRFPREELFRRMELIDQLGVDLGINANKELALDHMFIKSAEMSQ